MKVLAVRHGKVGHVDMQSIIKKIEKTGEGSFPEPQLNPKGRKQIRELAKVLKDRHIVAIYSSPNTRAQESAEIIGKKLEIPVTVDHLLKSVGMSSDLKIIKGFTAKQHGDKTAWQNKWIKNWHGFKQSPVEYLRRIEEMIQKILQLYPNDNVLLVAHEETIWTLLVLTQKIPFSEAIKEQVDHASVTEFEF